MMTNKKQRPQNGPGANSLRGGINLYSSKVIIGRWQDDIGGPIAFKRGFTTSDYDTEAQHQQRGATLKAPTYYGSALPITGDLYKTESPTWETTTRHMSIGNQKVEEDTYIPGSNMSMENLEVYRRTWTSDVPTSRNMRYQTESRRAGINMPLKYQTSQVRMLPGTPGALEKFRERLIERHGILAISVLRFYLGTGDIVRERLMKAISKMEIKLEKPELNQILNYSSVMTIEEFVRRIVARTDGFESVSPSPEEHFNRIFSEEADGVDIDFFIQKVNKANFYEVVQGLSVYLIAYSREAPGSITRKEFSLLLKDFFASSPVHYDNVVIELFQ